MLREDVDFLRSYLKCCPELKRWVRWKPLRILSHGRWRRARKLRRLASGVELHCSGGVRVRLAPQRFENRRSKSRLLRFIENSFSPCTLVKVLDKTDRTRHQTGAVLRVCLQRKSELVAVLAVYEQSTGDLTGRLLASLLLWWDQLRGETSRKRVVILLPESWSERVVGFLPRLELPIVCYKYRLDPENLRQIYPRAASSGELRSPYVMYPMTGRCPRLLSQLKSDHPSLDLLFRGGRWELSYLGLPVIWMEPHEVLLFDLREPKFLQGDSLSSFHAHLKEVFRLRSFPPRVPDNFYYQFGEERWLESLLLRNHRKVRPDFCEEIYCQVPTWVEGERKVLDLLTVTKLGQLAVLELKTQKDLSLVFQGVDYWERVEYHLKQGDFFQAGYFAGKKLAPRAPLLYLICPLFEFHSVLPVMKKFLTPDIKMHCIGINTDWKRGLRLLRRFEL